MVELVVGIFLCSLFPVHPMPILTAVDDQLLISILVLQTQMFTLGNKKYCGNGIQDIRKKS